MPSPENLMPPLAHPRELYIDGKWVHPSTDKTIDVIAPAREELYMTVAEADVADIEKAVTAARKAFDEGPWPRMSHAERASYLYAIADELDRRKEDIANIWPNEMGMLHKTAQLYSGAAGSLYRSYADMAETFPFVEERQTMMARQGFLVQEPVGVVGAIIPWNGPIMLIGYKIAPALLAGCTAVVKASPEAPGHALLMAEIAEAVGLPPGVLNVVTADREASEALVRNPGVDKIAFTGSSATGCRIASILGERMARYTLELGGKSAGIILDDYDIAAAAKSIAMSAPDMTGQVCASLTRFIVHKSRHDDFVDALSGELEKIAVGDPFAEGTRMGPLATRRQRDRVEGYIEKGRAAGFRVATGGGRPAHLNRGYFVEPTVFANVDNNAVIAREEIFGPVLSVIAADSEAHAIQLANDSDFGLNGSVFTNDADKAWAISRQLRSGTVGHNAQRMDFDIGFGGFKQSGVGREGGAQGLYPYLESKTVLLDGKPSWMAGG